MVRSEAMKGIVVVASSRHGTCDNHVAARSHHYQRIGFALREPVPLRLGKLIAEMTMDEG